MGKCHVKFASFENQSFPSYSSNFEEDSDFHGIGLSDDWWHVNPFVLECATSKELSLDYARVEFNAPTAPSITKDEPYATIMLLIKFLLVIIVSLLK